MCYSCIQNQKSAVTGHLNGHHQCQYSGWRHETINLLWQGRPSIHAMHVYYAMCVQHQQRSAHHLDLHSITLQVAWELQH